MNTTTPVKQGKVTFSVSQQGHRSLPPWIQKQTSQLLQQSSHALLLQGPSGLGQLALGMALTRAWLCHQPLTDGLACGHCASCHAIDVHTHADLHILMPETLLVANGYLLDEKAQKEIDEKKRKPSKEIRIDSMRKAIEFIQRTDSQGRGKVVFVYPAERMNVITANALLKTLEEPAGNAKLILVSDAAHLLLPTIRSRCISHFMPWPKTEDAIAWLIQHGLAADDAATLLSACGGRPDDALDMAQQGIHVQQWKKLPHAVLVGQVQPFLNFTPTQAISHLQKICHDLQAIKAGGVPRFFSASDLPQAEKITSWKHLTDWSKNLLQAARTSEHPYNVGLFLEDLLAQAAYFLQHPDPYLHK